MMYSTHSRSRSRSRSRSHSHSHSSTKAFRIPFVLYAPMARHNSVYCLAVTSAIVQSVFIFLELKMIGYVRFVVLMSPAQCASIIHNKADE